MSQVTEAIRNHHRELVNTLTAQMAALVEGRPDANPQAMAAFLKGDLLPHAVGEEHHLYPAVEPLIRAYGTATATMSVDHEFISDYINRIEEVVQALQGAGDKERPALESRLRRLALQLEAVLRVHLEKEERVYLPLFEQHLSEAEQQRVLDGMHAAYEDGSTVDVRQIPPPQRHPLYTHEWLCQQIVEKTYDAIIFADREGLIRLWNSGAKAMFGYTTEEALGQSLDLIIPERFRERHWEGYKRVMETGVTKYGKDLLAVPAIRKDGTRISLEFTIVLVGDESGKLLGTAAVIRDVTERWERDKELRQRLAALKAQVMSPSEGT